MGHDWITNLDPCIAPGLKEIKQVELFPKWRQFVPEKYKDETCPDPGVEVLNSVKGKKAKLLKDKEKEKKQKEKKPSKKRKKTSDNSDENPSV